MYNILSYIFDDCELGHWNIIDPHFLVVFFIIVNYNFSYLFWNACIPNKNAIGNRNSTNCKLNKVPNIFKNRMLGSKRITYKKINVYFQYYWLYKHPPPPTHQKVMTMYANNNHCWDTLYAECTLHSAHVCIDRRSTAIGCLVWSPRYRPS